MNDSQERNVMKLLASWHTGRATPEERKALRSIIEADPEAGRAAGADIFMDRLLRLAIENDKSHPKSQSRRINMHALIPLGFAAAVVVGILGYFRPEPSVHPSTYGNSPQVLGAERSAVSPADARLQDAKPATSKEGLKLGDVVPDVTMKDSGGKELKLSDYRSNTEKKTEGQIVVIHFGSVTCHVAISAEKIKKIIDPWKDPKAGVKYIAIYSDGHDNDTEKTIAKYIKSAKLACTSVVDKNKKLKEHFAAKSVNSTYVLDRTGKLIWRGAFGTIKNKKGESTPVSDAVRAVKEGKEPPMSDATFFGCPLK